jgi:diadenylate cyclase
MGPQDFLLDLIDILIVAWLFYQLFRIFRQTKAIRVLIGIFALVIAYLIAQVANFEAFLGLVKNLTGHRMEIAIILLVVIFAEEIKDTFAGIFWNLTKADGAQPKESLIEEVSRACESMASNRTGALIAIACDNPLDRWEMADSVKLNAELSAQLLETIFSGKTPLHDGAVLIRQGRIVAAKCQLPQSQNPNITKKPVGMRHRAAFGLCEMSDAVVITVSEERGWISIFNKGEYHPAISKEELPRKLKKLLGVNREQKPWYHPRRVFANGWLKAVAVVLACAIWAEQDTQLTLSDSVHIYSAVKKDQNIDFDVARDFPLTPGEFVITNPEVALIKSQTKQKSQNFEQAFPPIQYTLTGRNWARVGLLFKIFRHWQTNFGEIPSNLAGRLAIVLPNDVRKAEIVLNRQKLACMLVFSNPNFKIEKREVPVSMDRLAALDINLSYSGVPAKDFTVDSPETFRPTFTDGGKLLAPSRLKDRIEKQNLLNPCATTPQIDIEGQSDFEKEVVLRIPDVVTRWNPGRSFSAKVLLLFKSTELQRDAEDSLFTKAKRKEIEDAKIQHEQAAQTAEREWLEFEKKLKDQSDSDRWAENLTLQKYDFLQDEIRILSSSIESVKNSLKKTENMLKAQEQKSKDLSLTLQNRQKAEYGARTCKVVSGWQKQSFKFLNSRKVSLEDREKAIRGKLVNELAEWAKAKELRDKISKELAIPTLPSSRTLSLSGFMDSKGPTQAAGKKPAESIVKAAESRTNRDLFQQVIKNFEVWFAAIRESERLIQDTRSLDLKIKTEKARIRLELAARTKQVLIEAKELIRARQLQHIGKITEMLDKAGAALNDETKLLKKIVDSWENPTVERLALRPFFLLYRDFYLEAPQVLQGRKVLDSQFSQVKSTLAELLTDDPRVVRLQTEIGELRKQATKVSELWWDYQQCIHDRISVLNSIIYRIINSGKPKASEESALLAKMRAGFRSDRTLLRVFLKGERPIQINDYRVITASLDTIKKLLTSTDKSQKALLEVSKELDKEVNGISSQTLDKLTPFALKYSAANTRLFQLNELLIFLESRQKLLLAALKLVEPKTLPEIKRGEQALLTLSNREKNPVANRIPELAVASRELKSWQAVEKNATKLNTLIASIAKISSRDAILPQRVVQYYRGRVDQNLGIPSFVNLDERKRRSDGMIRMLIANRKKLAKIKTKTPAQETTLLIKQKELSIERADNKILVNTLTRCSGLLSGNRYRAVSDKLIREMSPGAAAALLRDSANDVKKLPQQLDRQISQRRKQALELQKAAGKRSDKGERNFLLEQVKVLDIYIKNLEITKEHVGRLLKKLPELAKKAK